MVVDARCRAKKAMSSGADLLEDEQQLTCAVCVTDGPVAAHEAHVAELALAGIPESAIIAKAVAVSVRTSALTAKNENDGVLPRGHDTAALLSSEKANELTSGVLRADNQLH